MFRLLSFLVLFVYSRNYISSACNMLTSVFMHVQVFAFCMSCLVINLFCALYKILCLELQTLVACIYMVFENTERNMPHHFSAVKANCFLLFSSRNYM